MATTNCSGLGSKSDCACCHEHTDARQRLASCNETRPSLAGHDSARILFGIAVAMYRCLHGTVPDYLSVLILPHAACRLVTVRSVNCNELFVPPAAVKISGGWDPTRLASSCLSSYTPPIGSYTSNCSSLMALITSMSRSSLLQYRSNVLRSTTLKHLR